MQEKSIAGTFCEKWGLPAVCQIHVTGTAVMFGQEPDVESCTWCFFLNRFVGADIWSKSYAKIGEAMGADGYRVNNQKDLAEALEAAKKNRRPAVIEIMTDGWQLAPPFRRDALALPTRLLPKYEHLDAKNFK